jgi:hypothetical protein
LEYQIKQGLSRTALPGEIRTIVESSAFMLRGSTVLGQAVMGFAAKRSFVLTCHGLLMRVYIIKFDLCNKIILTTVKVTQLIANCILKICTMNCHYSGANWKGVKQVSV